MDEELRSLTRKARGRPGDVGAAQRLDRSLARSGDGEELRRRYRLKFRCELRYDELAPTGDPLRQHCVRCDRNVHYAATERDLRRHVAAGRCVAFARRALPMAYAELAGDERLHSAQEQASPCVVPSELPFVDLRAVRIPDDVIARVPGDLAERLRVVPFAEEDGVLDLAVAELDAGATAEAFALMFDVKVSLHFADPRALDDLIDLHYGVEEGFMGGVGVLEDFFVGYAEAPSGPAPSRFDPEMGLGWLLAGDLPEAHSPESGSDADLEWFA